MLLLLGASGYIGHAFAGELLRRRHPFIPLTRRAIDYSNFNLLFDYIRKIRPDFLINAAGYTGHPDENACDSAREETLCANTLLPQTVARACLMTNTPWAHISSGSIYAGIKVLDNGGWRIEKDLHRPELRLRLADEPAKLVGFTEIDEPNCSFRSMPCSFYSGTKALAEEIIRDKGPCYVWRPGAPFDEREEPRNYLWRLQCATRNCDSLCSLSHVEDFVRACLALWEQRAPTGIYNVVNPGLLTTRQIIRMIERILKPHRRFEFWDDAEPQGSAPGRPPHFHSVLDATKLLSTRVKMRPVEEALEDTLRRWQHANPSAQVAFGQS